MQLLIGDIGTEVDPVADARRLRHCGEVYMRRRAVVSDDMQLRVRMVARDARKSVDEFGYMAPVEHRANEENGWRPRQVRSPRMRRHPWVHDRYLRIVDAKVRHDLAPREFRNGDDAPGLA